MPPASPRPWPSPFMPEGLIRVGMLAPCLNQGGAEAWMIALARNADPSRIAWAGTAVSKAGRTDPEIVRALGHFMPVAQGKGAMRSLAASCDVLVTWAIDGLPGILDGLPARPRVISAIHAPIESAWGRTIYAKAEGIDHWVGVSELALDALPEASKASAPSSVIWNAVDADRMRVTRDRAAMRTLWGVPGDAPVAAFLQRLTDEKDAPAAARLAGSLPEPWHVVLVGDGVILAEVERMRSEGGLDRLHLVGKDTRAGDVLNAADVFLACSDYESFCLSMAEAIWAGVPIVTTEVGLAKMVPGISRIVPQLADGEILAREVIAAHEEGQRPAAKALIPRLDPARFGEEWSDLIAGMVAQPARPAAPPYPGPLAMAGSFAMASVAHIANGMRQASEATQAERLATCRACPNYVAADDRCGICGCSGLKRTWSSSACPDNPPRWAAEPAGEADA